jgi:hypothetical protein
LRERVGLPLRLVLAILRSSDRLIDLYIPRDAPLSDDLERWPRLAAKAAPAAICCFLDFAGILVFVPDKLTGFVAMPRDCGAHRQSFASPRKMLPALSDGEYAAGVALWMNPLAN